MIGRSKRSKPAYAEMNTDISTQKDALRLAFLERAQAARPDAKLFFTLAGRKGHCVALMRQLWPDPTNKIISIDRVKCNVRYAHGKTKRGHEVYVADFLHFAQARAPAGSRVGRLVGHRWQWVPAPVLTYDVAYVDLCDVPKPETLHAFEVFVRDQCSPGAYVGLTVSNAIGTKFSTSEAAFAREVQHRLNGIIRPGTFVSHSYFTTIDMLFCEFQRGD